MTSKLHATFSRSLVFLTRMHPIMNKLMDSISYTMTPPSNASRLKYRDSQILGVCRDILRGVTKYILVFSFFLVFLFDEV